MLNVAFYLLAGTTVCAELGTLPPVSEDCQQLVNSITILSGLVRTSPVLPVMYDIGLS